MKKTSDGEPREKRPRISNNGSRKSSAGGRTTERSYRRSDNETPGFEGGSRKSYSRTKRTGGDAEAPVKQSREYKKDFRKPEKDFRAKSADTRTESSEPWKKEIKPRRSGSGAWKAEGGSRKFSRLKRTEGETEAPVKQSREYKKDFRKPDTDFRKKSAGPRSQSSEPWKKDGKPRSSGSGAWKAESGSRAPYSRKRKTEGETEGPFSKSQGYKKDFKAAKGESRKFERGPLQTEKIATKKSDRKLKVFAVPWNTDGKPRKAKSKARTHGKGPGADAYSRPHKASNGPHRKKI
jgi:hypothetical protein